jgi:hypothetical protein
MNCHRCHHDHPPSWNCIAYIKDKNTTIICKLNQVLVVSKIQSLSTLYILIARNMQ